MKKWYQGPQLDLSAFTDIVDNQSVVSSSFSRSPRDSIASTQSDRDIAAFLKSPSSEEPSVSWGWKTGVSTSAEAADSETCASPVSEQSYPQDPASPNGCSASEAAGHEIVEPDSEGMSRWNRPSYGSEVKPTSPRHHASTNGHSRTSSNDTDPSENSSKMQDYNNFRFSSGPSYQAPKPKAGEDYLPPTRVKERKTSSSSYNPLQFVKAEGKSLSEQANETIEIMKQQKLQKESMRTEDDDWQSVGLIVDKIMLKFLPSLNVYMYQEMLPVDAAIMPAVDSLPVLNDTAYSHSCSLQSCCSCCIHMTCVALIYTAIVCLFL